MKKIVTTVFLAGTMMVLASGAFAGEAKDLQGIYEECGLGGLLFPSWPIGASVSNFTWDWGSTASTSGLTTPDACKGGQAKLAAYIYRSYDSIERDLSKGDGEYLDMVAVLSGKAGEAKEGFIRDVRNKFRQSIKDVDYSSLSHFEKTNLLFTILQDLT